MEQIEDNNSLELVSLTMVIAGALNWGMVGLGSFAGGNWNVINLVLGGMMNGKVEAALYILIGFAGLYQIYFGYELEKYNPLI